MKLDVTGKKELVALKFDWKIYQLNAFSTKCCAGGTRDITVRHVGQKDKNMTFIPNVHDKKNAQDIASAYGYLRN